MVVRNRRDKRDEKCSHDGLEPCRRSVDARTAKAALKAFIAACGKAAAVTTVALAVGGTNVGCEAEPERMPGVAVETRITNGPADENAPTGESRWHMGLPPASEITEPGDEDEDENDPTTKPRRTSGDPPVVAITLIALPESYGGAPPLEQITTQPAKDEEEAKILLTTPPTPPTITFIREDKTQPDAVNE